ncbi:anthranilate phosphoribosyltransferase [Candidatus Marinamargulisbacteria bacterium SCGC AAA071-K20]|nr:anthranilate phosphoribosyltransferase [Candidatus Marinamargulisbacteria bacterium SCGC AAA071-K20]
MIVNAISKIRGGEDLTVEQAQELLTHIFKNNVDSEKLKDLLEALIKKGESVSEIVGFAKAMRSTMTAVPLSTDDNAIIMDVCGTGGVKKDRFNLSTASAFVLAAADVKVAKHGNYGSKKINGSFNFLEALEIPFNLSIEELQTQFEKTGLCFLFARLFHPAMKTVAGVRQDIGKRTIFNLLGPLSNPASVKHQIVGCTSLETGRKLAQALSQLGVERALVVVGADGLDELEVSKDNIILEINNQDDIKEYTFDSTSLVSFSDKAIPDYSDSGKNAYFFELLIDAPALFALHPVMALLYLNAGAGFYCAKKVNSIEEGIELAKQTIQSGELSEFIHKFKQTPSSQKN